MSRKNRQMFRAFQIAMFAILFSGATGGHLYGGDLQPGAPPEATSSYGLEDIYDRLDTGAAGAQNTFTEPSSMPGSTGHTVNEIMEKAPVVDDANGATTSDVISGKAFWGLTSGEWGVNTGAAPAAATARTGQKTAWRPGDDGELEVGAAWPEPRFIDNLDGTVTDNLTNLVWLKNASCSGTQKNWQDAVDFANQLHDGWIGDGLGGDCDLSDGSAPGSWRLPNIKELQSLIHYGYFSPALPNTTGAGQWSFNDPFIGVALNYYWSSTTRASFEPQAWYVNMDYGFAGFDSKEYSNYVWPVRGGR